MPPKVLRTAVTYSRTDYHMTINPLNGSPGEKIYIVMHFAELIQPSSTNIRVMNIYGGDSETLLFGNYAPPYLKADHKEISTAVVGRSGFFNMTINVTASSTLSFMINALESYIVRPKNESQTVIRDGETSTEEP